MQDEKHLFNSTRPKAAMYHNLNLKSSSMYLEYFQTSYRHWHLVPQDKKLSFMPVCDKRTWFLFNIAQISFFITFHVSKWSIYFDIFARAGCCHLISYLSRTPSNSESAFQSLYQINLWPDKAYRKSSFPVDSSFSQPTTSERKSFATKFSLYGQEISTPTLRNGHRRRARRNGASLLHLQSWDKGTLLRQPPPSLSAALLKIYQGPLIGQRTTSQHIVQEYAQADPTYVTKTEVGQSAFLITYYCKAV